MKPYVAIVPPRGAPVVISHFTDATSYILYDPSFPAPRMRDSLQLAATYGADVVGDEPARRLLPIGCLGDDEYAAEASLNALRRVCEAHRAQLVWQSGPEGRAIQTTIRLPLITEETVFKLRRGQGTINVLVELITDPEWRSVTGVSFDEPEFEVTEGTRPAHALYRVTSDAANESIGFGIKHDPQEGYEPHDVYAEPSAETLTDEFTELETAHIIDTAANSGASIPVARVATTADEASSTLVRAVVGLSGSGVPGVVEAPYTPRAARETDFHRLALPMISIPAGGVPGTQTEGGYGPDTDVIEQDTGTEVYYITAFGVGQTFLPPSDVIITAVSFHVVTPEDLASAYARLGLFGDLYQSATADISALTDGLFRFDFDPPVFVPGDAGVCTISLYEDEKPGQGPLHVLYADDDPYPDGHMYDPYERPSDDLRFIIHGQLPLGFDSRVTLEAACSESSKTATATHLDRLPADDFAAVVEHSFGVDEGVLVDATDPLNPAQLFFTTDVEGTGGIAFAPIVISGDPRPRPGPNKVVFSGDGDFSVAGTYYPCWSDAAAGEL